jgi:hypothetical protein
MQHSAIKDTILAGFDPLAQARIAADKEDRLARCWKEAKDEASYTAAIDARYADATCRQLVKMVETDCNEDGHVMNRFEFAALYSQWLQRPALGPWPTMSVVPRAVQSPARPTTPPLDDTMLSRADMARMVGRSLA